MSSKLFFKVSFKYVKLIHIFGNVLMVNSGCYGLCYVKIIYTTVVTFVKFHTHLEENLEDRFKMFLPSVEGS